MVTAGSGRPAIGGDMSQVRTRSKHVFGNMDRLVVAAAIARREDGLVDATDLSEELGVAVNRVRAQLLAFTEAGLLMASPENLGRRRTFIRRPSAFWDLCTAVVGEWAEP
jgi:hypothetical protein